MTMPRTPCKLKGWREGGKTGAGAKEEGRTEYGRPPKGKATSSCRGKSASITTFLRRLLGGIGEPPPLSP
eukprot:CAMPEP_0205913886 /NCGR_PEP_ID=MMETSP1325-20131115/6856_1 /ASSEMBLY_ACC=CAM_ASM_000708 /TAXON_ID=236786 /ORGANISM="Florenciella sp., Strain RCC1007" /LENGTH=69 /DNA_ID=CAMNT_0053280843 /DNA_START=40 /DNA_END=245 /DNA_ORIENTATION=+